MTKRTIILNIPRSLRDYSGVNAEIPISATNVAAALGELQRLHPELHSGICDETGEVRRHINVFVNSTLVDKCHQRGLLTPLNPGDVLTIWTAVSGG